LTIDGETRDARRVTSAFRREADRAPLGTFRRLPPNDGSSEEALPQETLPAPVKSQSLASPPPSRRLICVFSRLVLSLFSPHLPRQTTVTTAAAAAAAAMLRQQPDAALSSARCTAPRAHHDEIPPGQSLFVVFVVFVIPAAPAALFTRSRYLGGRLSARPPRLPPSSASPVPPLPPSRRQFLEGES